MDFFLNITFINNNFQVLTMMDADKDGLIKVDHVLKVIELLGVENTELPARQIRQIISVLCEEENIKVEDTIEDILLKKPRASEDDEAFQQDLRALEDFATYDDEDNSKRSSKSRKKKLDKVKKSNESSNKTTQEKQEARNGNGTPH